MSEPRTLVEVCDEQLTAIGTMLEGTLDSVDDQLTRLAVAVEGLTMTLQEAQGCRRKDGFEDVWPITVVIKNPSDEAVQVDLQPVEDE